ncbi:hypothetical protein CKAH01_16367 [Colletotrichum kahawae]|uniref:Uncharacterized protein n=1 Tax=Colletotrichum kahawae TaxID=34407 RepID=A0AAD9YDI7_COLKA|nr:hypothetical protein CKAH01_16367 [Colletotrichum kahawae]
MALPSGKAVGRATATSSRQALTEALRRRRAIITTTEDGRTAQVPIPFRKPPHLEGSQPASQPAWQIVDDSLAEVRQVDRQHQHQQQRHRSNIRQYGQFCSARCASHAPQSAFWAPASAILTGPLTACSDGVLRQLRAQQAVVGKWL